MRVLLILAINIDLKSKRAIHLFIYISVVATRCSIASLVDDGRLSHKGGGHTNCPTENYLMNYWLKYIKS